MVAIWCYDFEHGNAEEIIDVPSCYQNEDGGFDHGLDGNCLNPNSMFAKRIWTSLEVIYKINMYLILHDAK